MIVLFFWYWSMSARTGLSISPKYNQSDYEQGNDMLHRRLVSYGILGHTWKFDRTCIKLAYKPFRRYDSFNFLSHVRTHGSSAFAEKQPVCCQLLFQRCRLWYRKPLDVTKPQHPTAQLTEGT